MLGPIEIEVIRNALTAAAAEMDVTVWRTSRSTIVRELLDYSTAVFDAEGNNVAQSARIPQHLNSMGAALRTLLDRFVDPARWGPEDVVITNDPYCGAQHLNDVLVFKPVFHEGVRVDANRFGGWTLQQIQDEVVRLMGLYGDRSPFFHVKDVNATGGAQHTGDPAGDAVPFQRVFQQLKDPGDHYYLIERDGAGADWPNVMRYGGRFLNGVTQDHTGEGGGILPGIILDRSLVGAPANVDEPEITAPDPVVPGKKLRAEGDGRGTWVRLPKAKYQFKWLRDEVPIPGANKATYITTEADAGKEIKVEVRAENNSGSTVEQSAPVAVQGAGPKNTTPPSLSGSGKVGTMITCDRGEWEGSGSYSYEWRLNGVPVPVGTGPNETGSTNPARYRAKADEVGAQPAGALRPQRRDDDLVDAEQLEGVLRRDERVRVGDHPGGQEARGAGPVEELVQLPAGAVGVDALAALLGDDDDEELRPVGLVGLLAQALLRALVVVEHARVVVELDEVADPAQHALGVADEVLELDLHVVAHPRRLAAGRRDALDPELRRLLVGLGAPVHAQVRERDVTPVADDVDEARLREHPLQAQHLTHVPGGLVPVAGLALALRVQGVKGADRVGGVQVPQVAEALAERVGVEVEVGPALALDDEVRHLVGGHPALLELLDELRDPVRLAGDRQVRVRVEHEPQQRRARAHRPDDEDGARTHGGP